MEIFAIPHKMNARQWWKSKRRRYNLGLVLAGIGAFLCYCVVADIFIIPYDSDFEINLLTTIAQGIGYLVMIGIANLFYFLGYWADVTFNKNDSVSFRVNLFNMGFWFSFALPFAIPILVLVQYFVVYRK